MGALAESTLYGGQAVWVWVLAMVFACVLLPIHIPSSSARSWPWCDPAPVFTTTGCNDTSKDISLSNPLNIVSPKLHNGLYLPFLPRLLICSWQLCFSKQCGTPACCFQKKGSCRAELILLPCPFTARFSARTDIHTLFFNCETIIMQKKMHKAHIQFNKYNI